MREKSEWLKIIGGIIGLITAIIMLIVALKMIPSTQDKKKKDEIKPEDAIERLKDSKKPDKQKKESEPDDLELASNRTSLFFTIGTSGDIAFISELGQIVTIRVKV